MRTSLTLDRARGRTLLCAVALFPSLGMLAGCGLGTAAVGAAAGSGGGGGNGATVGSDFSVGDEAGTGRAFTSPAFVRFLLTDQEAEAADVEVLFAVDDPGRAEPLVFQAITLETGSNGLTQVPSGTPRTVLWRFDADLPNGSEYEDRIVLRLRVLGGISPDDLTGVEVGNDAPVITSAEAPEGESAGLVPIEFQVADSASDPVKVRVEYYDEAAGCWCPARPANKTTTPDYAFENLPTTPEGSTETFVWDSAHDRLGRDLDVQVRFTADDEFGTSAPRATPPFHLDNNDPPRVLYDNALFVNNPDETRGIPIPFVLQDAEEDDVRVVVQWRREGRPFPTLDATPAEIEAILADPVLREERQIGTELPLPYGGLARPLGSDTLSLPELAGPASGLLAGGMAGRTLEILRAHSVPLPVASSWEENPLHAPVAVLPVGNGPTALVLDSSEGRSWRLSEIDLATGRVVREASPRSPITASSGDPDAMAWEPGRTSALVASSVGGAWQVHRVDLARGRATHLLSGLDGSTELGRVRGLLSLGSDVALITVGSSLIRLDLGASAPARATTLLDGLATPWGIAADPLQDLRVYVAERDGVGMRGGLGRVITVKLDTYVVEEVFTHPDTAPGEGLERPTAIALERNGARLLAVTDANPGDGLREVRGVDIGGKDTGVVFALASDLPADARGLAVGPDQLRLLALPSSDDLAVGGGVLQRRGVVDYDPAGQVVTVDEPFDPLPAPPNASWRWRMARELGSAASSEVGEPHVFVWDSTDVPEGRVALRIVPMDRDVGLALEGLVEKRIRSFDDPIFVGDRDENVQSVAVADLDGDGRLDIASATLPRSLSLFFQPPGGFVDRTPPDPPDPPDVTLGGATGATVSPHTVVAVDLNGDGRLDLASANEGLNGLNRDLSVFFQPEEGFADRDIPNVTLPNPQGFSKPIGLEAADLDRDGLVDLAASNTWTGTVHVFFQTSPGRFAPETLLGGGRLAGRVPQVEAADLDGDGCLDLACTSFDPPSPPGGSFLKMFLQTGPRQFQRAPGPSPSTGVGSTDVLATDLDGDGRIDLASANRPNDGLGSSTAGDHTITLHFQEPGAPGRFPKQPGLVLQDPGSIDHPANLVGADLNADGRLDLISANYGSHNLTVFLRDSKGGFPTVPDFSLGGIAETNQPQHHVAADVDGDGHLDLVTASQQGGARTLFLQNAPGRFDASPDFELGTSASTDRPGEVVASDLDGDGLTDLASANADSNDLTVFFQRAAGRFATAPDVILGDPQGDPPAIPPFGPVGIKAADLNGDGRPDLVSANRAGDDLTIFWQTSPGEFDSQPTRLVSPEGPESVAVADLNGDGLLDLVSATRAGARLRIFHQPLGGWEDEAVAGTELANPGASVATADVNGDGEQDLVSGREGADKVVLFLQETGMFRAVRLESFGALELDGPRSVAVADLDEDGDLDLVSANFQGDDLTLFFQPRLGFVDRAPPDYLVLGGSGTTLDPESVAAADVDGDGDLDLVAASSGTDDLTIFLQSSPGRFATLPDLVLGGDKLEGGLVSIVAADLNSDGELDLASALHRDDVPFGNDFDGILVFFGGKYYPNESATRR